MGARLLDYPAAAMACLSGQGALLHDQHSCERIQAGGSLRLGRCAWLGERSFAHARMRGKERRGGSRMHVRAGLEELASNQARALVFSNPLLFFLVILAFRGPNGHG
jgi:hypothetical protein